jgi:hypothetical protein
MKIDTEHLHYWMQAIRQSTNPMRTMDAFWSGQIKSKEWLIDMLKQLCPQALVNYSPVTIDIFGGWVGSLSSMLFQDNDLSIKHIRSIDIDSECKSIAIMMNKKEEMEGKFTAISDDMCNICSNADIIINTSCEHITQNQYNLWLNNLSINSLIVLQSNNYNIPEHIRFHKTLDEFKKASQLKIIWEGEMPTQLYTRYMIIGFRNV